jgi:hypothetical protein
VGGQTDIKREFFLNPSMGTIKDRIKLLGYFKMHFEMNFVIDVVKKVLVVVKRVHLIDTSFALTHVKVNLLSFFFINQIFA